MNTYSVRLVSSTSVLKSTQVSVKLEIAHCNQSTKRQGTNLSQRPIFLLSHQGYKERTFHNVLFFYCLIQVTSQNPVLTTLIKYFTFIYCLQLFVGVLWSISIDSKQLVKVPKIRRMTSDKRHICILYSLRSMCSFALSSV